MFEIDYIEICVCYHARGIYTMSTNKTTCSKVQEFV